MAAKTAAELAANDPRLKAMLMELGSARFDEFPMEDGEGGKHGRDSRVQSQPAKLTGGAQVVVPKVPIKSAWAKAIQRGDFDDDDAAKVSGMDPMADGQLARARRNQAAAATAFSFTNANYERTLRRDRNGHVPPRATVGNVVKRQLHGVIHVGDGPIDIDRTLSGAGADRRDRPVRGSSVPVSMVSRGSFAGGPSSQPSIRPQAAAKPERSQIEQSTQQAGQPHVRVVLPDGAAVVLELPSTLAAAVYPKTSQRYRGTVYLVSGPQSSGDLIILAVQDKKIPEIRHSVSQYDTYMSVSHTGLMLKFDDSKNGFNFYGVEFKSASDMKLFVQNLRTLVERPKQPPQEATPISPVDNEKKSSGSGTIPPVVNVEPSQPSYVVSNKDMKPLVTRRSEVAAVVGKKTEALAHKPEERKDVIARCLAELQIKKQAEATSGTGSANLANESANVSSLASKSKFEESQPTSPLNADTGPSVAIQDKMKPFETVNAPVQQIDSSPGLHPDLIKEITEWAWDTARYMQHSVPEQFGFDTMRTVIGASCAAVLGRTSPSFRNLSASEQRKFIADHAQSQVESGFLEKLGRNEPVAAKFENTDVTQIKTSRQLPKVQTSVELQAEAPSKLLGPIYEIGELLSMRTAAAAIDPGMLPKIPLLSSKTGIPHPKPGLSRVPVEAQVQQAAAANSDWLYVHSSLRRNELLANMRDRKKKETTQEVSSKVEALADFLSPTTEKRTSSPSAGLCDSIHNRGGVQSQSTGALGDKSAYHKDLEDLIAKSTNKSNAFDHKVVKATEGISRLSLK